MVRKIILPVGAIIILLVMVMAMAGMFSNKVEPGRKALGKVSVENSFVVKAQEQNDIEAVSASIKAKHATLISSRILARITAINVRAGDAVSKGQVLVCLEQSDLKSRVSQARANAHVIEAKLSEAKSSLKRASDLQKKGVFSQADLDKAVSAHDSLSAQLSAAKQARKEADATLGYADIRSPIDGVVVDRFSEPGDTASPGVQLLSLYNPDSLRIEANVREGLALKLELGQSLKVEIPSLAHTLDAVIEEIVPAGNPGSRSFLVKARLNTQQGLLPGMYAKLLITAGTLEKIRIPEAYVAQVGQLDIVWVVEAGKLEKRFVRLGQLKDGFFEVISGLKAQEVLIVPK